MRDYLYLWNDPAKCVLCASGIEFRDVASRLGPRRGMVLLAHDYSYRHVNPDDKHFSGIEALSERDIRVLIDSREDIYRWGDCVWVDYVCADESDGYRTPRAPTDHEIAELLFLKQMHRPLERVLLPALQNRFMYAGHDDGWRLLLYYHEWQDVAHVLAPMLQDFAFTGTPEFLKELHAGQHAYWVSSRGAHEHQKTMDIDAVLRQVLWKQGTRAARARRLAARRSGCSQASIDHPRRRRLRG